VHVDGEGGGGGVIAEPALLAHRLGHGVPEPAQLARDAHLQVPGVAQLLEVLEEEAVLPVVARGALLEALEHLGGQRHLDGGLLAGLSLFQHGRHRTASGGWVISRR
jgi:hypothetical protein